MRPVVLALAARWARRGVVGLVVGAVVWPALVLPALAQQPAPDKTRLGAHNLAPPSLYVGVRNHSEPEICAEKDNIDLRFAHPQVRSFRIQAQHPVYISMLRENLDAPDFTACDMSADPVFKAQEPRQVTLYEDMDWRLVGQVYPAFWRPADVAVKVGARVETGLHLLQLFKTTSDGPYEVLVLYPPDGYWRARPLAPAHLRAAAYGSSFMVGPVTFDKRPLVAFTEVRFDPKTLTFTFPFRAGGEGRLQLETVDTQHIVLGAHLSGALPSDKPFAALRSMYITDTNNDVARLALRNKGANRWAEQHILDFTASEANEIWAGRHAPSRHNIASPDMIFSRFAVQ